MQDINDIFYKKYGNLVLTDKQRKILIKYNIDIEKFNSNQQLIFYLEQMLYYDENEELDRLSSDLSEIYYYNDINK